MVQRSLLPRFLLKMATIECLKDLISIPRVTSGLSYLLLLTNEEELLTRVQPAL